MQRTRDAKVALEGTTEKDRLRMIAWEVKIRLQPIIFAVGDSTIEMDIFNLHETGADVRIIEGNSQELLIEDNVLDENSIAILDDLPLRKLTKDQKTKLKREIIEKFVGKVFSRDDFNRKLNSLYADLISLMVREKQIIILKQQDNRFKLIHVEHEEAIDLEHLVSQSLVIIPKMVQLQNVAIRRSKKK